MTSRTLGRRCSGNLVANLSPPLSPFAGLNLPLDGPLWTTTVTLAIPPTPPGTPDVVHAGTASRRLESAPGGSKPSGPRRRLAASPSAASEAWPSSPSTQPWWNTVRFFDQQTDFDGRVLQERPNFDVKCSQATARTASSSRGSRRTAELRPASGGLSVAAWRENLRREQYSQQLDRAHEAAGDSPSRMQNQCGSDLQAAAALEAEALDLLTPNAFLENASALDHQIEDMARNIRLDHLGNQQEDRARSERDEARKRREAELRRARKKEQEAKDPHKKVALRIENKRRFELDIMDEVSSTYSQGHVAEIPMQQVEVVGAKGREKVSLVDVRLLRSRCQMLDGGANVRTMLDRQERKERSEKAAAKGMLHSLAASAPELSEVFGSTASSRAEETYEDRLMRVLARRHSRHVDNMVQKISHMRNKLPYDLPFRFDVLEPQKELKGRKKRPSLP